MSINLTELFETLCNNFFKVNQDIDAIIVSDVDGLIMEEFNINEYLEKKMISFLFFRIGEEYRLEIFDQLKVMFSTIESVSHI